MKKLVSFIVLVCLITISTLPISADDSMFDITGGLDLSKAKESTFDTSRTISGTAPVGTEITIKLFTENNNGTLIEKESYTLVVGSSGYFSQNVDFYIGANHIIIESQKNDLFSSSEVLVNRKDSTIMNELKQSIALPGKR